ncbi:nucleic acid-binding, OB-fold-like protein [Actinidia rufa]|uniref:Nucleic acid-binding, OB-fold-like protein n=1 Tax=Actinidia rufa TaxID=165716 RepID=A0A7J0FQK3_9ERIC|nr:nucleic acid-binding, OB-fold-like protein [Actinidia rufa]
MALPPPSIKGRSPPLEKDSFVTILKAYGELLENTRLNEGIAGGLNEEDDGAGDDYIEFKDEDIDKM